MKSAAGIYRAITSPEPAQWGSEYYKYFADLALYGATQHYPLLLAAYRAWGKGKELGRLVRTCSVIIFRHFVVGGHSPTRLEPAFRGAIEAILKGEKRCRGLLGYLAQLYFDNNYFRSVFREMTIAPSKVDLTKHILFRLEAHQSGNDYSQKSNRYNLEHILPRNPTAGWGAFEARTSEQYLWRIGNLTLLDTPANRQAGSGSFTAKRPIYAKSRFQITRECAEYEEWTPTSIVERQDYLGEIASDVWRLDFKSHYE